MNPSHVNIPTRECFRKHPFWMFVSHRSNVHVVCTNIINIFSMCIVISLYEYLVFVLSAQRVALSLWSPFEGFCITKGKSCRKSFVIDFHKYKDSVYISRSYLCEITVIWPEIGLLGKGFSPRKQRRKKGLLGKTILDQWIQSLNQKKRLKRTKYNNLHRKAWLGTVLLNSYIFTQEWDIYNSTITIHNYIRIKEKQKLKFILKFFKEFQL